MFLSAHRSHGGREGALLLPTNWRLEMKKSETKWLVRGYYKANTQRHAIRSSWRFCNSHAESAEAQMARFEDDPACTFAELRDPRGAVVRTSGNPFDVVEGS